MPDPDFNALQEEFLKVGIAPDHARRACRELQEHYEDLVREFREAGLPGDTAKRRSVVALGRREDLVAAMNQRRELKTWAYRYPRAAVVFYPLACLVALPVMPVVAGVTRASLLARWGASLLGAGILTAALLLLLQLTILFA
jgi:hypothetical protein